MSDAPTSAAATARRPLSSRNTAWAAALARRLVDWRIRPNAISLLSVAAAAAGGAALIAAARCASTAGAVTLYVAAAAGIQLRLLCNLMDGMVAVEGGMGGPLGELYNDLPDRFADAFVLVGAGYAAGQASTGRAFGVELGWLVAALAVLTAYVRVLGAAAGARHYFLGPMAKPHRMAVMTVACLAAAGEQLLGWPPRVVPAALALVAIGCVVTMGRRLVRIAVDLRMLKGGAAGA